MRSLLPFVLVSLAASGGAQVKVAELDLGPPFALSVSGATFDDDERFLYCSLHVEGRIVSVDLSVPAAPRVLATTRPSVNGNSVGEPVYFDGRVYTGQRDGGLYHFDAFAPDAGALPEIASTIPSDHWRGLRGVADGGALYLLASEASRPGAGGGLLVLDGDTLATVGSSVSAVTDAAAFVVTTDGRYAYAHDPGARASGPPEPLGLNTFDISSKSAPFLRDQLPLGSAAMSDTRMSDLIFYPGETHLYSCGAADGLHVIDIRNRLRPTLATTLFEPSFEAHQAVMFGHDILLLGVRNVNNGRWQILRLDVSKPDNPVLIDTLPLDFEYLGDMLVQTKPPYSVILVGRLNGAPHLQVWQ